MAELIKPSRRRFLFGASALVAAPAVIRVSALMPVSTAAIEKPDALGRTWEMWAAGTANTDFSDKARNVARIDRETRAFNNEAAAERFRTGMEDRGMIVFRKIHWPDTRRGAWTLPLMPGDAGAV